MKLYAPSTINEIKKRHDFKLSKSLGQNFLTDKNIVDKIIEAAEITEEDLVIEIGPGLGTLTVPAAQQAGKVICIEVDKNLIPILRETLRDYDNIDVINQDVLKTDLNEIVRENLGNETNGLKRVKFIGNLPYYITTPIIMKILEEGVQAESIVIMMQKEVADRIKADAGSKTYGALSVAVQYYCTVDTVAMVPKEVFIPKPKVDSTVLRLNIRKEKSIDLIDEKVFFECIKNGFGQRRKTLSNSLTGTCGLGKEETIRALEESGIDPIRRAETLSLEEFAKLANTIYKCK